MILVCGAATGCRQHSTEKLAKGTATYALRGTVLGTDPARGEVMLQHDAIPGFMDAMTMPYKLIYPQTISELHRGDVIRARLLVDKTPDGDVTSARIDEIAVLAQAKPNFKPTTQYNVPVAGQPVPDFHFINQSDKAIDLKQFRGKTVLITFIYTRCPLGDFCPRMSRNFASIDTTLRGDVPLYHATQLLSISFDPAFDTPSVLRSYGMTYTGSKTFDHWQFAAPRKDTLPAAEHFFNVGVTESGNSLTHSLSTILIDPNGKLAAWYAGSEWEPAEVVAKMRAITPILGRT